VVLANLRSRVLLSPVSSQESQRVNLCVVHMYTGDPVTVIPSFMLAFLEEVYLSPQMVLYFCMYKSFPS
jgi:hypothetical protein